MGIPDILTELFQGQGFDASTSGPLAVGSLILGVFFLSVIADIIAKRFLLKVVHVFARNTRTAWDDYLVERKFFARLAHVAPAIVVFVASNVLLPEDSALLSGAQRLVITYLVLLSALVADSFLSALVDIASTYPAAKDKPLKSYAQVVKILTYAVAFIIGIAALLDRSPWALLSGLGAMTAILLLVFKDSILGLVASVQLSAYDLVRVGDWIEFPKFGADGDVIDISLNVIKVQNWDKTITTIPTHALLSDSFKNWRGMSDSGGRRIKRALSIDMQSVHFLSHEDAARLKKIEYISEYLAQKIDEVEQYNSEKVVNLESLVNGRRLTNLGTFRAYIESYLRNHPNIHQDMTLLVRQLAPQADGLPIEIYCFSNDQRWSYYEGIIGDIFDHMIAALPEFGLRVFQYPSGSDFSVKDLQQAQAS